MEILDVKCMQKIKFEYPKTAPVGKYARLMCIENNVINIGGTNNRKNAIWSNWLLTDEDNVLLQFQNGTFTTPIYKPIPYRPGLDFHWVVHNLEFSEELCLQFDDTELHNFITMKLDEDHVINALYALEIRPTLNYLNIKQISCYKSSQYCILPKELAIALAEQGHMQNNLLRDRILSLKRIIKVNKRFFFKYGYAKEDV